jgi:hypothetical protein
VPPEETLEDSLFDLPLLTGRSGVGSARAQISRRSGTSLEVVQLTKHSVLSHDYTWEPADHVSLGE